MAQQWNSALPGWSYPKDSPEDIYIRSETDVGPGKTRRRTTNQLRELTFELVMDGAQRAILDDMYHTSVRFEHEDPKDNSLQEFKFSEAPQYEALAGSANPDDRIWRVTLNVRKV